MFTHISLKNFKSFNNLEFDLCEKANTPKKLILIYGENGSGKTNLISSFALIKDLLKTMQNSIQKSEILKRLGAERIDSFPSEIVSKIMKDFITLSDIISSYRTIGTNNNEPTIASYDFVVNEKIGNYTISFNNEEILTEKLTFQLYERKTVVFDFSKEVFNIKKDITNNKDFYEDLFASTNRYWGKHCFLSILYNELVSKSSNYAYKSMNNNFLSFFLMFMGFTCILRDDTSKLIDFFHSDTYASHPREGKDLVEKECIIDEGAKLLKKFLQSFNPDITDVYYKKNYDLPFFDYELILKKKINSNIIEISHNYESIGIKRLIDIFFFLLNSCSGEVVILDECDSFIHDLFFAELLSKLYPYINGQIILTTHNTYLLDIIALRNKGFVLNYEDGNHTLVAFSNKENKIFEKTSVRNKYIHGEYGPIHFPSKDLNFSEFAKAIIEANYKSYSQSDDN